MSVLSIVLPAYNEEQNIPNTAKVLAEFLDRNEIDYELVFISDGSKDNTYADACLSRMTSKAYRLECNGRDMRKS